MTTIAAQKAFQANDQTVKIFTQNYVALHRHGGVRKTKQCCMTFCTNKVLMVEYTLHTYGSKFQGSSTVPYHAGAPAGRQQESQKEL
jgi:hypothetical protein